MTVAEKTKRLLEEVILVLEENRVRYYLDKRSEKVLDSRGEIPAYLDSLAVLINAKDELRVISLLNARAAAEQNRAVCAFPDTKHYPVCLIRYCDTQSLYMNILTKEKYDPPGLHVNILVVFPAPRGMLLYRAFQVSTIAMLSKLDPDAYIGKNIVWLTAVAVWRILFGWANHFVQKRFLLRAARAKWRSADYRFFYDLFGRYAIIDRNIKIQRGSYRFGEGRIRCYVAPAVNGQYKVIKPRRLAKSKLLAPKVPSELYFSKNTVALFRTTKRRMWRVNLLYLLVRGPKRFRDRYLAMAFRSADRIAFYMSLIDKKGVILEKSRAGDYQEVYRHTGKYVEAVMYYLGFDMALCFDYEIYVATIDMFLALGLRKEAQMMAELLPPQHIDDIGVKYERYKQADDIDALPTEWPCEAEAAEKKDALLKNVVSACETGYFVPLDRHYLSPENISERDMATRDSIRNLNYKTEEDEGLSETLEDEYSEIDAATAFSAAVIDEISQSGSGIVVVDFRGKPYELYELKKKIGLFHLHLALNGKTAIFFIDAEMAQKLYDPHEDIREVEGFRLFHKIDAVPDPERVFAYVGGDHEWLAAFKGRSKTAVCYDDGDIRRTMDLLGR